MSYNLPGEANPFEPPRAGIGGDVVYRDLADNDAELIRREHLGREANIKSLGSLNYLGAFFALLYTIALIAMAAGLIPIPQNAQNGLDPSAQKVLFGVLAVVLCFVTALYGALGYGLSKLQAWARWTMVAFTGLGLLGVAAQTVMAAMINPVAMLLPLVVGGGINGFILYLLVSRKANVVFSKEYKDVIRKTPHIKQKMSILVKILLVILLLVVGLIVVVALFAQRS